MDRYKGLKEILRRACLILGFSKVRINNNFGYVDGLLYCDFGTTPNSKIAGFDAGATLIRREKINQTKAKSKEWRWWDASVHQKLWETHQEGFKIVIFSNQENVSKGIATIDEVKTRFDEIYQKLKIPFQVFAAIK